MASISEISIDLKFTGLDKIEQATKASRGFQREIRNLIREEKDGALTTAQFASRIGDIAGRLQKTTGDYNKAAKAVFEYKNRVQETIAQENAMREARAQAAANKALAQQYAREAAELEKVARASQQYINSVTMLERGNKSAEASAEVFARQIERVDAANLKTAQAFGQTVRAVHTYTTANKSAEASAEVFARQLDRVEKANLDVARSFGDSVRAIQQSSLANKSAADSAAVFTAQNDRVTKSYNQLRASIDQSYAARMRLKQAADTLRAAERQGLITRQEAIEQLRLYRDAAQQAAMGGGFMGRNISRAGVLTQQAGYQVGDFIVQVQSGTNAFVAFGQQATQIAGTLTLLGGKWILLGSVLGIAIPLLTAVGAAFMRTRKAAEDAADGVETLGSRLQSARSELGRMTFDIERLRRGFGDPQEFALVQGVEEAQSQVSELTRQIYELEQLGTVTGPNERALEAARELLAIRREDLENYIQQRQEQERLNALQDRRAFGAEQTMDLQNQIRLYEQIAQFGEESAQVEAERARQARGAFQLEVMREGIYGQQLVDLMAQYDAMVDARDAAADATAEAESQNEELEAQLEIARQITEEENRRNQQYSQRIQDVQNEIRVSQIALQHGRDSVEVQTELNRQARARIVNEMMAAGHTAESIAAYITLVRQAQELSDAVDASSDSTKELANEMSRAANEALRFIQNLNSGGGVNAALARVAGLRAELAARQGGAGDIEAARERARAEVMARPEYQAAMQGPVGLQRAAQSGLQEAIREAELNAEASILSGRIGALGDTGGDPSAQASSIDAVIAARQRQIEQERVLLGLRGEEQRFMEVYFDLAKQNEDADIKMTESALMNAARRIHAEQEINRVIEENRKKQEQVADILQSSMEDAFMSIVDGTKSVKDAFKAMAADIIKELYRIFVVKRITGMIANAIAPGSASLIPSANGNVFNAGNLIPFANGGVVGGPTLFPMSNGKTGLMGEAGPEAIMPLKRGKDGKLGVQAEGGGGQPIVINQTINVSTGVQQTVRAEIKQLMPQIAESAKSAVVDAKRRGGSYGRAFA